MSLLDAAANADNTIFDGVAQIAAWASGQAYFPSTAAFCDAWNKAEVCGGTDVRHDQTKCQSHSSAYGCGWGEPSGYGSGNTVCLDSEGAEAGFEHSPYFWEVFNWYETSILREVTDCGVYSDADSCNMHSSDCVYLPMDGGGWSRCTMGPNRRVQILEEAGAPAHATSLDL